MSNFVHLHVHSHYSLLDGLPKIKDLVKAAKARGFDALALTDHGTVSGVIEFYKACKEQEMKAIIGCEAYIAPVVMTDRDPKHKYHHLVLLVETQEGYNNLMKLATAAHLDGFYYKPRMDKELLRKYHHGLIASSACFAICSLGREQYADDLVGTAVYLCSALSDFVSGQMISVDGGACFTGM